jgi:hypothetical protein
MSISSTLLSNTPVAISPSLSQDAAITVMFFCNQNVPVIGNPTAGQEFISVYAVASGDTTSLTNRVVNEVPIEAGDTFTFSAERLVLSPGDRVWATTTNAGNVSVTISYVTI